MAPLHAAGRAATGDADAARAHGATAFWAGPLRLAPLVKEHYLGFVAEEFPGLVHRYQCAYSGTNAPRDYQTAIARRVAGIRERHGFAGDDSTQQAGRTDSAAHSSEKREAMGQLTLLL